MAKSTNIDQYPEELFDLIRALPAQDQLSIYCDSKAEAQAFRFEYYAFKRALSLSINTLHQELFRIANKYVVQLRGTTLHFTYRSHSSIAQTIRNSLAAVPLDKRFQSDRDSLPKESQDDIDYLEAVRQRKDSDSILETLGYTSPKPSPSPTPEPTSPVDYQQIMEEARRNSLDEALNENWPTEEKK